MDETHELNDDQQRVMDLVMGGSNVFFTGSAGTGKSYLIKRLFTALSKKHGVGVIVTAPTGVAALLIGGSTIHRWAGIRYEKTVKGMVRQIRSSRMNVNA